MKFLQKLFLPLVFCCIAPAFSFGALYAPTTSAGALFLIREGDTYHSFRVLYPDPNYSVDDPYAGSSNGIAFNAEGIASTYLSKFNAISSDPNYGFGYTKITLAIDSSSYFSASGQINGSTAFSMSFTLIADEPFYLEMQGTTQAGGSAMAEAQITGGPGSGGRFIDLDALNYTPTGPLTESFSQSALLYQPGHYNFTFATDAEGRAVDGSASGDRGAFSSLSFRMTAYMVPEPSTALFGVIGVAVLFRRRIRK